MEIKTKDFQAPTKTKIKLKKWRTKINPFYASKISYEEILLAQKDNLDKLQRVMYADNHYALLLIFQGMDASGKDSAIRHVMSGVNPQGCDIFSFKQPSAEELEHDFLWRTTCRLPERGKIGVFNRSYYEEVLITRVHPEILQKQHLPQEVLHHKNFWQQRYQSIINFENHLHQNGTQIIKFYLHLSKQEQAKRFLTRIDEPDKNWKLSLTDISERQLWKKYMRAYETCLSTTSTKLNPWYIIPADDKENARLIISQIILEKLSSLKISYPAPNKKHKTELLTIRKLLEK